MGGGCSSVVTGTEFWAGVFGRRAEVEIEIGPGTGQFLLCEAARRPEVNFLAIENSRSRAEYLAARAERLQLANVRVLHAPAQCIVHACIPATSVAAYHIYFPDPWWKRRHHRRRLLTPGFGADVARTLVPGGKVYFATDVEFVWELALACFGRHGGLSLSGDEPRVRNVRTSFERKGLRRGARIFEGTFLHPGVSGSRGTDVAGHTEVSRRQ